MDWSALGFPWSLFLGLCFSLLWGPKGAGSVGSSPGSAPTLGRSQLDTWRPPSACCGRLGPGLGSYVAPVLMDL